MDDFIITQEDLDNVSFPAAYIKQFQEMSFTQQQKLFESLAEALDQNRRERDKSIQPNYTSPKRTPEQIEQEKQTLLSDFIFYVRASYILEERFLDSHYAQVTMLDDKTVKEVLDPFEVMVNQATKEKIGAFHLMTLLELRIADLYKQDPVYGYLGMMACHDSFGSARADETYVLERTDPAKLNEKQRDAYKKLNHHVNELTAILHSLALNSINYLYQEQGKSFRLYTNCIRDGYIKSR